MGEESLPSRSRSTLRYNLKFKKIPCLIRLIFQLQNIRQLYGIRNRYAFTVVPKLCSLSKIDAAFSDDHDNTFIFAGDFYYDALNLNSIGQPISTKWSGLPGLTSRTHRKKHKLQFKTALQAQSKPRSGSPVELTSSKRICSGYLLGVSWFRDGLEPSAPAFQGFQMDWTRR